jgi:hypothetical protein
MHGSAGRKPILTAPQIWWDPPNRASPKHGSTVSCWVGSTTPQVKLAHAHDLTCISGVPSSDGPNCHNQNGWCRMKHYSDNLARTKLAWTKDPESNHMADVVSHGRSIKGVKSLQCWMEQVKVSQCLTGG